MWETNYTNMTKLTYRLFIVKAKTMMLRRKQSDSTKARIAQSMRDVHANRSEAEKEEIRQKQSQTMKQNWDRVSKVTIDDILAEGE